MMANINQSSLNDIKYKANKTDLMYRLAITILRSCMRRKVLNKITMKFSRETKLR